MPRSKTFIPDTARVAAFALGEYFRPLLVVGGCLKALLGATARPSFAAPTEETHHPTNKAKDQQPA